MIMEANIKPGVHFFEKLIWYFALIDAIFLFIFFRGKDIDKVC